VKIGPTSLAVIDPHSNKVAHAIELGFKSNLIAAGEGYVWVVDPNGSTLWKIDPREHRVAGIFPLAVGAGEVPFGLAVGEGSVWVAVRRGTSQVVLELGPELGDLRRTIRYGGQAAATVLFRLQPLAVGGGAVWAIDPAYGGLWRIPPRAGRARQLAEGLDALSLAVGQGVVWVAGASGVTKIDAVTGLQLGSTSAGSQAVSETASVALGLSAAWFVSSAGRTMSKLDPQSPAVEQTFAVGNGPSGVAVGDGAVWVANSRDGTVSRVNPGGGKPKTIKLGSPPGGIVAAYGAVWTSPGESRS
jgi:streptogramin lyase